MKTEPIVSIETGSMVDGTVVYRSVCKRCKRAGAWLENLHTVERNADLHVRSTHATPAAA